MFAIAADVGVWAYDKKHRGHLLANPNAME